MKLRDWQEEASEVFKKKDYHCIFEVSTGSGKTFFAIYNIIKLGKPTTLIVVPTVVLMYQWVEELKKQGITDVGLLGDGNKKVRPITIGIVNSLRGICNLDEIFDFVIADEMHRYGGVCNFNPFKGKRFKYAMGLTATVKEVGKFREVFGDVDFKYSVSQGQKDGILCPCELVNVGVEVGEREKQTYLKFKEMRSEGFRKFKTYQNLTRVLRSSRFEEDRKIAGMTLKAESIMKKITNMHFNKLNETLNIVKFHASDKTIIFNEVIGAADKLSDLLTSEGISCGKYHSKSKDLGVVRDFDEGKFNTLIACKSLDQGLDVKTCEVGIINSGTNGRLQQIQRIGRTLRISEGKDCAFLYQVYCKGLEDEQVKIRTNHLRKSVRKITWI